MHADEKRTMKIAQNASTCTEMNSVGRGASVISATETVQFVLIIVSQLTMTLHDKM